MRRRAARWRTQKQFSSGDECSASNQLKGPGARLRGFFQELANRMRTSVRRRRRKRRLALSWINSGFVPPFGRVRTWRAGGKSGSCNTYVVVQVPRRVGGLASRRIEKAVKKGVEEDQLRSGVRSEKPLFGSDGLGQIVQTLTICHEGRDKAQAGTTARGRLGPRQG